MGVKGDRSIWEAETEGVELVELTIGDLLDIQAEKNPEKEALVYNYPEIGLNLRYNYRQYRDEVNRVAKGLLALGVEKGDHVAVWAPNLPEWVMLHQALARVGAVMVTVNTLYKAAEIEYILRQGDISLLFMVEEVRGNSYLESLYSVAPELKNLSDPGKELLNSANLPRLKRTVLIGQTPRPGFLLYKQMLEMGESISDEQLRERQASINPHDVAIIMYTSGTTGFPKGAMSTHYNIVNTVVAGIALNMDDTERHVTPMPLFHVAGANFIPGMIYTEGTLVPLIGFDPTKWLELIDKERGTSSFCVPAMIAAILNHPRFLAGEFDLSAFTRMYSGGAPVPVALMEQVKDKLGADCRIYFGMTESAGASTRTLDTDSFELKSATVGKPYPHLEIKIVNPASGEPVPLGERGELLARGFMVMKGYYNMPEKTADTIDEEGWLHTGDLATMNQDGYINIVGRIKDMVIRGGENIYPAEIEAFLMKHPKIAEAQVLGVPDSVMGEELVALIRLRQGESLTEEEVRDYCKANISRYKVPKYIRFVTEYPMTASGKIKKFELRESMIKELGLENASKVKTA
ncbi:MAG TPA: AMP-binding protein [Chloroflexia bacterium]|nr:AMP-binding protein [Chloroflexia bacterium]